MRQCRKAWESTWVSFNDWKLFISKDMISSMKELYRDQPELFTIKEARMLCEGYRYEIDSIISVWNKMKSYCSDDRLSDDELALLLARVSKLAKEIIGLCKEMIQFVENCSLFQNMDAQESYYDQCNLSVFYHKTIGDAHRIVSLVTLGNERKEAALAALNAYRVAYTFSKELGTRNVNSIDLAVGMGEFYEMIGLLKTAMHIEKEAYDNAICGCYFDDEEVFECAPYMQRLRDNLTLQLSDLGEDEE